MGFNVRRVYATGIQAEAQQTWALGFGLNRGVPVGGQYRGTNVEALPNQFPVSRQLPPTTTPTATPTDDGIGLGPDAFEQKPDVSAFTPFAKPISLKPGADLGIGEKGMVVLPWEKKERPSEFIEFTRTKDGLSFGDGPGQPTYGVSTGNQLIGMSNGVPIFR